ncbi:hypothetical protein C6W23_09680 [Bacillus atrophaeus]|nr:hypothetical protein C6W23_09680 [Bacillus atrophaeus]
MGGFNEASHSSNVPVNPCCTARVIKDSGTENVGIINLGTLTHLVNMGTLSVCDYSNLFIP